MGINLRSHSRRQHADVLIKYKNIGKKPTLNNILASRHKQGPVLNRTDTYNVLV